MNILLGPHHHQQQRLQQQQQPLAGTWVVRQQVPSGSLSTITSLSAGADNKYVEKLIVLRTPRR